mmetsp:Transcript_16148/g.52613  ORF Transcript_16148/g.52613 Transcript_16148/m.52613 type:complete len:207 (-) Transcript_16148:15-635(-)
MLCRRSHAFLTKARASAAASALAALRPSGVSPLAGAVPTIDAAISTNRPAASRALRSRSLFSMMRELRKIPKGSTTRPSSDRPSPPTLGELARARAHSSREPAASTSVSCSTTSSCSGESLSSTSSRASAADATSRGAPAGASSAPGPATAAEVVAAYFCAPFSSVSTRLGDSTRASRSSLMSPNTNVSSAPAVRGEGSVMMRRGV